MTYQEKTMPVAPQISSEFRPAMRSEQRHEFRHPKGGNGRGGDNTTLLLAGLAVVGLGALAWFYLGDDVRRYIRMETM
jgi:hypothetical protein